MALRTLGTTTTTRLPCLPAWAASLAAADVAAIGQAITLDSAIASILSGYGPGATAALVTGTTNGTTAVSALAAVSGAPISQIKVGDLALGDGVTPGTFVTVAPGAGTALTLSQATASNAAGVKLIFVRLGSASFDLSLDGAQLFIPQRGVLKVLPGDIVAVDNTGWPILVSGASVGYSGSDWVLT